MPQARAARPVNNGGRNGTPMALVLSRYLTEAHTELLVMPFHVAFTGCVFAFLAFVIVLS